MKYWYQKVSPQLTDYVRSVLVLESTSTPEVSKLPLYTQGMPALLCRIANGSHQVTLFGLEAPIEKWLIEDKSMLIAFFFKPFAISTIFKISAKELKEGNIELNLWNAQKVMALNLQLCHSESVEQKIEVLSSFIQILIAANQNECKIIRIASDRLMENSNPQALAKLLEDLHLTERTFQRVFKKYVGITPNQYRRICQFYLAFSQLKGVHFQTHTDVAYINGYFDQSHYIRSFKEFAEITPNEYLLSGLSKKE